MAVTLLSLLTWSAAAAPITLRFIFSGTSETEKAWSVRAKDRVEAAIPNVRMEYLYIPWSDLEKKLVVMLRAGDVPDLLLTLDVTNLVAMGALEPLDAYIKQANSRVNPSLWYEGAWNYSTVDGSVYSLPLAAIAYGLVVREDILAAAGYKPEDIKTWDDLVAVARVVTKGDVYGFGYAAGAPRFAWRDPSMAAWSNGLLTLDNTTPEARAAYLEVLHLYAKLRPYMPPAVVAWSYPDMFRAYAMGQLAMIPNGSFFAANVYPINPDVIQHSRVIPFPKGPSGKQPAVMVGNVGVGMFRDGKSKELAWRVLEELTTRESITSWSALINMPARKDIDPKELAREAQRYYPKAFEASSRIIADFGRAVEKYGVAAPKILNQAQMEVLFQAQVVPLLEGKLTPERVYEILRPQLMGVKGQ